MEEPKGDGSSPKDAVQPAASVLTPENPTNKQILQLVAPQADLEEQPNRSPSAGHSASKGTKVGPESRTQVEQPKKGFSLFCCCRRR